MSYFIPSLLAVLTIVFSIITIAMVITFKKSKQSFTSYRKSREGKSAIASAGLGVGGVVLLSALLFLLPNNSHADILKDPYWFNHAGVYIGLDYTRDISPQCSPNNTDSRGTSNLGAWINLLETRKKDISVNLNYTHHSCFIGTDRNTYDAIGINLRWYLYKRAR